MTTTTPEFTPHDTGQTFVALLRASLQSKGLNASMKLSNSIESRVIDSPLGLRLEVVTTEGQRYWQILNQARRGRGSNPLALFGIILDWSRLKPISFASEQERRGFAAATSRKIQAGGYMDYKRDQRKNWATDAINSPDWMAAETNLIEAIAEQAFAPINTFFQRPEPAT